MSTTAETIPPVAVQIKAIGLKPYWYIDLSSILLFFTTVAIVLRVYVRGLMLKKSFGFDDAALLLAYAVFVVFASLYIAVGAQQKSQGVIGSIEKQIHFVLAAEMTYILQGICLKIALAMFFLRIVHARWQQWLLIFSVSIYTTYMLGFALTCLFQCGNPQNLVHYDEAKCLPWNTILGPMNYIAASLNAVIDWLMTATPISVIMGLQMNKRDKFSVCFLMLLGLLGSIVSIVRIPLVHGLRVSADIEYFHNILPISFCSIVEAALGTTALSLAALRPLFRRIHEKASTAPKTPASSSTGPYQSKESAVAFGCSPVNNDLDDDDDKTSKSELVDSPVSNKSRGRRARHDDDEWHPLGRIRRDTTTVVSSARIVDVIDDLKHDDF